MNQSSVTKVLMTADTVGGVWTYAVELIRAFETQGIHVLLATMGRRVSPEQREDLRGFQNVELAESTFRLEWMDDPWRDLCAAGDWLLGLERDLEPDIVHLNGYAHGALPWRAPTVVVAHSCVLSWWQAVKGEPAPSSWREYHRQVKSGLHAAGLVIAPTHAMRNCLVDHYGYLPATRVIPNGRRTDLFQPKEKEPFVLSAGRLWDEAKNVKAVCASATGLPWPVCLAGESDFPNATPSNHFPAANIRSLGRLTSAEMVDHMARASIFAHPAKYEPFGLSVLEAALSGCALILGDIPSLSENWNGAASFVNPGEPKQLRRALSDLVANPAKRRVLAHAAMDRGRQFDIANTALNYIDAYESLLNGRASVHATHREECVVA